MDCDRRRLGRNAGGLAEILADSDHEVVAAVGNAGDLLAAVDEHHPDAAVVDACRTDEGLRAAIAVRRDDPETGALVFSEYIETRYAADLLGAASGGGAAGAQTVKDRVADVEEFVEAPAGRPPGDRTWTRKRSVTPVSARGSPPTDGLGTPTARERDVLALMAEGRSNTAIAGSWVVSEKSVEKASETSSANRPTPRDADHGGAAGVADRGACLT